MSSLMTPGMFDLQRRTPFRKVIAWIWKVYSEWKWNMFDMSVIRSSIITALFSQDQERLVAQRRVPVLRSQLEEYKSAICQLRTQKQRLQTEVSHQELDHLSHSDTDR